MRILIKILFWIWILAGSLAGTALAQYDYIDIRNPSMRKIPLAVPPFQVIPEGSDIGARGAKLISQYLDFTAYFKIIDPGAFLLAPDRPIPDPENVDFNNWVPIGAELLITGNALVQGDLVDLELRLFDAFKQSLLLGKRYKGYVRDLEKIIRRFCSEVIYHLTGHWGVFDSKLAFISNGTGSKEIYVCDFDGSNIRRLTTYDSITLNPAWSSDGKWMAYTSYDKGRPDLYIQNLRENRGTVVSKKGINIAPAWVPNGTDLAATLSFSGDQEIYLLSRQGQVIRKLTDHWGIDTSPTWAPDGKRFAFVSSRSGTPQIYIKEVETGRVERLTYQGRYNTQPSWSPRGDRIAYSAMERGEINIHVIDVETRTPVRLTYHSGKNESPTWSPDGSLIAFSTTREGGGEYRLYVMTAYGTDQRRLLDMPGEQTQPAWSPRITE